jgi:hypothetical protein
MCRYSQLTLGFVDVGGRVSEGERCVKNKGFRQRWGVVRDREA